MIRVLRHYLPIRKALFVASETLVLSLVIALGMTWHLIGTLDPGVFSELMGASIRPGEAVDRCVISSVLLALLAQLTITLNELYDYRVSASQYERASRFVGSAGSAILVGGGTVTLARLWHLDRVLDFPGLKPFQLIQTLVFTLLVGFIVLYFWRNLFHWFIGRWHFSERVLILGAGDAARQLAQDINERPYVGYEAVAIVPDDAFDAGGSGAQSRGSDPAPARPATSATERATGALAVELLRPKSKKVAVAPKGNGHGNGNGNGHSTTHEALPDLVRRMKVDRVIVALEDRRRRLPIEDLLTCRLRGISVQEYEEVYEGITGKIAVQALRPSYLIFNEGFGRAPWGELAKRSLDLVMATSLLLLTWPIMLVTALLVRFDSPGSVLFRQQRIGRDGAPFTVLKFRSMRADAEKLSGPVWAQADDPRITRIGKILRKSRLDELPQLFNVLMGDMSLVGPRPERGVFVEELSEQIPYFNQRHIVKPGLTGWAQINYPYGNTVEDALQKLQYDLFYIKYQSLLFDLSILFNTVKTVLLRKGT